MIASSGSMDSAQAKALQSLLIKANGGVDEAEEKAKEAAEKEEEEKEGKKKQEALSASSKEQAEPVQQLSDIETFAKEIASNFAKIIEEAQENTRYMAQPVGMFKNLSPDWGHEKDKKQFQRTNTTVGRDYNPNGMGIQQPRAS